MASYIKTLKEDNGDITYPQTLASAVFTSGGSDVETEIGKYVTAEDIASTSALTPPVTTNMIADGAVTPAKIASSTYSTSEQAVGTWIDGKTIYRKVVTVTSPSFSVADHTYAHGISNFDDLVDLRTLFNLGWDTTVWATADFLSQRGCSMRVDPTYVHWENSNSSIAVWTGTLVFVIEYTKSS